MVSPEPRPHVRLISCDLFAPGSLKSGTLNFWKMEGVQKVTFSILNLYSQMHFRSQVCPGGHLEGFEACLKRRSELRTRARNLFVFQRKIKDFNDNLKKIIVFQRKINNFRLQPPADRFHDTFEKTPPRQECEKYAAKSRKCDRGARFL